MTSTGAVDAETCPYWWFAATRGSQHNQEMTKALIVKRIAARIGARRGRITTGVTVGFDPACFPAPSVSRRLGAMGKIDRAVAAEFRILFTGYVGERVASTVSFVREGDVRVIVDPGMVPELAAILGPLAQVVDSPDEITDVIFSHHHPDH